MFSGPIIITEFYITNIILMLEVLLMDNLIYQLIVVIRIIYKYYNFLIFGSWKVKIEIIDYSQYDVQKRKFSKIIKISTRPFPKQNVKVK